MRMNKHGAFLTLGMAFVSVLLLSLGAAMLRNAEHSEERMMELASTDRLFNVERSLQHAYREMLFDTFGFNITHDNEGQTLSLYLLPADTNSPDWRFHQYLQSLNTSEEFIRLLYNFTSTPAVHYAGYNQTSFFVKETNVSYAYFHTKAAAYSDLQTLKFPTSLPPKSSNALVLYTRSADTAGNIDRYVITLRNDGIDGNVSWETRDIVGAGNGPNLTVEYYGTGNRYSVDSGYITFDAPSGQSAQNITINMSAIPRPWPLVSVSKVADGPFKGMGQIIIQPFSYNFTASVMVLYKAPRSSNITAYSYDTFNLSFPRLGLRRDGYYRLV